MLRAGIKWQYDELHNCSKTTAGLIDTRSLFYKGHQGWGKGKSITFTMTPVLSVSKYVCMSVVTVTQLLFQM